LVDLKNKLASELQIKDLGVLKYFLRMVFARSKKGIFVNKMKYVIDLLEKTGLLGCRTVETPTETNLKLQAAKDTEIEDKEKYQRLVGRFIYLSHTRPYIAFAINAFTDLHQHVYERYKGPTVKTSSY